MRALVTGGAGFIGSHLVDTLLARGDAVVVLDDLSTGSFDNLAGHADDPRLEVVVASVLDERAVDAHVRRCDVVFHLAAVVGVRLAVERPLDSLATNLRGTEVVVESARRHGRRVLLASTSEVYGRNRCVPLAEEADRVLGSPLVSRWSYSMSKAAAELVAHASCSRHGVPVTIARLFNTIGPRQSPHYGMVVPRFVDQALSGGDLTVHGDGTQSRAFAYVGDVAPALVALAECDDAVGQAVNLGSPEEVAIRDVARLVIDATGSSSGMRYVPYGDVYGSGFEDVPRRCPDISRARRLIGFAPRTTLREAIELTVARRRAEALR